MHTRDIAAQHSISAVEYIISSSMARFIMAVGACSVLIVALAIGGALARNGPPKKVRCDLKEYPHCYGIKHVCPKECRYTCVIDCVACKPVCNCDRPGAVCQDPRFIGGDGITFYFHGQRDRDFCLLSDSNLHINAHFIGKRNPSMSRDFTWVQSLGILFSGHRLFLGAQNTAAWDDLLDRLALEFDGEPIFLPQAKGSQWRPALLPTLSITRSHDANGVVVEADGNFRISATVVPITDEESRVHGYGITDDDCFAHLDLGFKFYSLTDGVNGVLGQTYASNYSRRVDAGAAMPVMGGERDFSSSGIFAADCAVARFNGDNKNIGNGDEDRFASLRCSSGMDGRGVVCKR